MLSFIPGAVAWPDHFDLLDPDNSLVRVARIIRDFHDAAADFDWDTAAPGTRLWDVAYALHGFVPLSADRQWSRADAGHRVRVFVDAYGLDEAQRRELILLLAARTRSMFTFLAAQAAADRQPWTQLWHDGHGEVWRADADYIDRHIPEWEHALFS